jgi:Caspase domain
MSLESNSRRWLFCFLCLSFIILYLHSMIAAQTRRAFLVGINDYVPAGEYKLPECRKKPLKNLRGCINDVDAINGILQAQFLFNNENIHILKNGEATRERIISDFKKYLIQKVSPGDTCVFYYSGHGSWVKNLKSNEEDHRDETLVPADWYRGRRDIRDKELKKLFNQVLDKKANLTVIVDACHSGSISRGIPVQRMYRAAPPGSCIISESPDERETPAERGALILSAARSFQEASEFFDENTGTHHGLFTWALLNVLRSCSINESVATIMLRVDALMQSEGREQRVTLHHPTTEAPLELIKKPLFGTKLGERFGIIAAVDRVRGDKIILQAGFAAGIRKNCQLRKITDGAEHSTVLVRVTNVEGLNRSQAKVISGNTENIESGDLFEIHKWVASREARMRIWIPTSPHSLKDLTVFSDKLRKLKIKGIIDWVEDPTEQEPTHVLEWYKSYWRIHTPGGKIMNLGKHPEPDRILKTILSSPSKRNETPGLFVQLPVSLRLNKAVRAEIDDYKDSVKIQSSRKNAHYILAGRYINGSIQYTWLLPGVTGGDKKSFVLPKRTEWLNTENIKVQLRKIAIKFSNLLLRLVRIRAWFQLPSPPDKGEFPYLLALKNADTGTLKTTGPLKDGEIYGLVLKANRKRLEGVEEKQKRYVYVFSIDNHGKSTLLFPPKTRSNSENYFPAANNWPMEINLGKKKLFAIGSPFGMDTYVLLTTAEAISNPNVLEFQGVHKGGFRGHFKTPLERLLYITGSAVRGAAGTTDMNWSIQRLHILSINGKK